MWNAANHVARGRTTHPATPASAHLARISIASG